MRIFLSDTHIAIIKKGLLGIRHLVEDADSVRVHIEASEKEFEDPDRKKYVEAAKKKFHKDGEIEVDEDAQVSKGDDPGAYVQAWVWVYDEDAGVKAKTDSQGDASADRSNHKRPLIIE